MENPNKNGGKAIRSKEAENLEEMAVTLLKTSELTGNRYGMNYMIRLVTGDMEMQFRKPEHGSIETFGLMREMHGARVRELICYLVRKGLMYQTSGDYPVVRISQKGREYLENPVQLGSAEEKVTPGKPERRLLLHLRMLREEISKEENKSLTDVFTEATLQHLCMAKPKSESELLLIYGIGPWKSKKYGARILEVIHSFREGEKSRAVTRVLKAVTRPTYQETRVLFLQGLDAVDIATRKGVKISTVRGYLERLHLSGQIDVRAWIEKQVDRKTLHRAVQFFREATDNRLRTAHDVLGLDLVTLRLCRLYLQPPAALCNSQAA